MSNKAKKCPLCNRGYIVASMASSYYYCNNCYKYVGDITKASVLTEDMKQSPLFSDKTVEEVEELLNSLLA